MVKKTNAKTREQLERELDEAFLQARPVDETAKTLREAIAELDHDPAFLADVMKGLFIEHVLKAMEEEHVSKSDLAERLGKSRQYVGHILNENANFTIETIAEIAVALGRHPYIGMHQVNERIDIVPSVVRRGSYVSYSRFREYSSVSNSNAESSYLSACEQNLMTA
jgi:transcriptional regulator with XRE-family HTH domain